MADERDFELLDDYLSNRMSEQDRSAYEQKIKADPDLQHEYALQQRLIRGIQNARIAELKSMLNNVPVPANSTGGTLAAKVLGGTLLTIMLAAAGYWWFMEDNTKAPEPDTLSQEQVQDHQQAQEVEEPVIREEVKPEVSPPKDPPAAVEQPGPTVEADKNQTSAGTEHSKPSLAGKPDPLQEPGEKNSESQAVDGPVLDVFTPETEGRDEPETTSNDDRGTQPAATPDNASLIVETDRENRRYSFHYQFREGKVILYGPFEQNLYEIMEFFADEKRTVFLYYNDRYYRLEEADNAVRPLQAINDPALLKKLKEYRSSK